MCVSLVLTFSCIKTDDAEYTDESSRFLASVMRFPCLVGPIRLSLVYLGCKMISCVLLDGFILGY
jgi:hypothetical protein